MRDQVSSMKYVLSAFIASCMMVNSLIPHLRLQAGEYDLVAAAVQSQKVFLQVFSLSLLPLEIMDELLAGDMDSGPVKKRTPDKDSRDRCAGEAVSSIGAERSGGFQRAAQCGHSLQTVWIPLTTVLHCCAVPGAAAPPGIFLCLLLFSCRLLPRSGLCENGIGVRITMTGISAQPAQYACWVFPFYNTSERSL
jgi:hypothetical protein